MGRLSLVGDTIRRVSSAFAVSKYMVLEATASAVALEVKGKPWC